jgi:ubiquinone/menaquinone biosynthesis C-methylase UbiE
MEDPREAMRLELKVNPEAWVKQYLADRLPPGASILSVGCGPGAILRAAAALHSSIRVTGIDISESRIQDAISRNQGNVQATFVCGNAYALPFPSGSFDIVYSRMLLEYLADKKRAVAEMTRVCQPGGLVLLQDLDGQLLWHYPEDPELQLTLQKTVTALANTGFDPFVGRKLFGLAQMAGLTNINVQVECYHLIAGQIDSQVASQWELKLEIALPQIAQILGGEVKAREHCRRFLNYLRRPDTLTYSNVFTVVGEKPL